MAMASLRRPSFRCFATCGAYSFDCFRACENVKIRSIATPNEIMDMMIRITPMTFATHPICSHMCIRSIRPSSDIWKNPASRKVSLRPNERAPTIFRLLQCEVDCDRHDDRHGHVVEQRRRELPLLDRVERGLIEQRLPAQHL